MKKGKKLLVTASLVSTAMTVGGCRFLPWMNSDQAVYGAPMDPRVTLSPIPGYEEDEEDGTESDPVQEEDTETEEKESE